MNGDRKIVVWVWIIAVSILVLGVIFKQSIFMYCETVKMPTCISKFTMSEEEKKEKREELYALAKSGYYNDEKSLEFYKAASDLGDGRASAAVGWHYILNDEEERDEKKGRKYLELAEERGVFQKFKDTPDDEFMDMVWKSREEKEKIKCPGQIEYEEGVSYITTDIDKAYELIEKAASKGNVKARCELAGIDACIFKCKLEAGKEDAKEWRNYSYNVLKEMLDEEDIQGYSDEIKELIRKWLMYLIYFEGNLRTPEDVQLFQDCNEWLDNKKILWREDFDATCEIFGIKDREW